MRQRNDTGHVVDVAAYPTDEHPGLHPFSVGPGEVIDFPELLGGFTETEAQADADAGADSDAEHDPATGAKTTSRKRAAQAATSEGVEQQ